VGEQPYDYKAALAAARDGQKRSMDEIPDAPDQIPASRYLFQLQGIEMKVDESSGYPFIGVQHCVEGGECDGSMQYERLWVVAPDTKKDGSPMPKNVKQLIEGNTKKRIIQLCEGAGLEPPQYEEDYEEIVNSLQERTLYYHMTLIKKGEYTNVGRAGIEDFVEVEGAADEEPEAEPEPQADPDEEADDPDYPALFAIVGPAGWDMVGEDATLEECVVAATEGVDQKDEKGKDGWFYLEDGEVEMLARHGIAKPKPKAAPKAAKPKARKAAPKKRR